MNDHTTHPSTNAPPQSLTDTPADPAQRYMLEFVRVIRAPRPRVFNAWRDPDRIRRWFAPGDMTVHHVEVDFRVGGRYELQMQGDELCMTHGEYREIVPDEKLVFTWCNSTFGFHETLVTIELADRDGGTELRLTHRYFLDEDERTRHQEGWDGCIDKLAARINDL